MGFHDKQDAAEKHCPYLDRCDLIQNHVEHLPGLIDRFKARYCLKRPFACSRRWIWDFLGAEKVPELMMPQQRDWAEQLLFEAGIRYSTFREKYGTPL